MEPGEGAAPPRGGLASRRQRVFLASAIFLLFLGSSYAALATLSRVTPALFPGRSLRNVGVVAAIHKVAPVPEPGAASSFNDPIRVLILGVDKRAGEKFEEDEEGAYLTDVVMVASVDPLSKQSTMLSFPRDMLVEVHHKDGDVSEQRLNMSYQAGVLEGGSWRAGAEQVERDLQENFGVSVDYFLVLDFEGVERLVDAVGGVEIDVPPDLAVHDWWYSDDDRRHVQLDFPAGVNRLDGYHAVAFGRNRDGDSDLVRIKRQQLVVEAAVRAVFSSGILSRSPMDLWDAYHSVVKTNIPRSVMPGLADLARQTNGSMALYSLGDSVANVPTLEDHITRWGEAVLVWRPENVQYWLSRAFPETRHADAVVEIRNGYGDPGQGAIRAAALEKYLVYAKGLATVYEGGPAPQAAETSVLFHRPERRAAAEEIARWLSVPDSRVVLNEAPGGALSPDITVIVGRDFVLPGSH